LEKGNKQKLKGTSIVFFFLLLPFDALPVLPGSYRPILAFISFAVFPIFFYYFVVTRGAKAHSFVWFFFAFYITSVPLSFIKSYFIGSYAGSIDFTISISMGITMFLMMYCGFDFASRTVEDYIGFVVEAVKPVIVIMLIVGGIEALSIFVHTIFAVKAKFIPFIAQFNHLGVQWLSREPAWGSINMLFLIPFLRHTRILKRQRVFLIVAYIELLLSLSATAIITVLLIEFFFYFTVSRRKLKVITWFTIIIITISLTLGAYFKYSSEKNNIRQIERFRSLVTSNLLVNFLKFSSSETIRIGFPAAGVMEMVIDPLTGVGGGNSRYYMGEFFYQLMPWGKNMNEVRAYLDRPSSSGTPRSLFPRILGETGIIGFGIFFIGVFLALSPAFRKETRQTKYGKLLIHCALTSVLATLQFDTFLLVPFWLGIVFVGCSPLIHEDFRSMQIVSKT